MKAKKPAHKDSTVFFPLIIKSTNLNEQDEEAISQRSQKNSKGTLLFYKQKSSLYISDVEKIGVSRG